MIKTLLIEKLGDTQSVALRDLSEDALPNDNVTVRAPFLTLTYKVALAICDKCRMVPREIDGLVIVPLNRNLAPETNL